MISTTISIFGAGRYGQALATSFNKKGLSVCLYARNSKNGLQANIVTTTDLSKACAFSKTWLLTVPTSGIYEILEKVSAKDLPKPSSIIIGTKGLDPKNQSLLDEIVRIFFPQVDVYALSGPGFSSEIHMNLPTALTLAGPTLEKAKTLAKTLSSDTLRLYPSDDVKGVLFGGAFKNVLAIGAGMIEGAKLGENARAAFLTRGFSEMRQLAVALGAKEKTLFGLSGLGDLILTGTSLKLSRNYNYGFHLIQSEGFANTEETVEGLNTLLQTYKLSEKLNLDLPLAKALFNVLNKGVSFEEEMKTLLQRPLPEEE